MATRLRVQSKEAVMLIKEPSLHGLIAKSVFPVLSRSGERLCARKNISPSLTLKSELEAIHIGMSNGRSFLPHCKRTNPLSSNSKGMPFLCQLRDQPSWTIGLELVVAAREE